MSTSSREAVLAVCSTLLAFSVVAVGLRCYARKLSTARFMADDWTAAIALISYVGTSICVFIMVHYRVMGYSSKDFTPVESAAVAAKYGQLRVALNLFTTSCLAFTKLSAVFFYRRIFCTGTRVLWFDVATAATIVVVALWYLVFQLLTGFQCGVHIAALWDGRYHQYCTALFSFPYALALSDFILDVVILILPVAPILRIRTTWGRKISILGVFLLAFVGLGASIARVVQYTSVEEGGETYLLSHDPERILSKSYFLAMLEAGMSLVAVNLPSIWPICTSTVPKKVWCSARGLLSSSSRRGSNCPEIENPVASRFANTIVPERGSPKNPSFESAETYIMDLEGQGDKNFATPKRSSTEWNQHVQITDFSNPPSERCEASQVVDLVLGR